MKIKIETETGTGTGTEIDGKYLAKEIMTIYNTVTKEVTYKISEYIVILTHKNENQILARQIYLSSDSSQFKIIDLLYFKDLEGWTSKSYKTGIDRLFYQNGILTFSWSNEINSDNVLQNANITLVKVSCQQHEFDFFNKL